MIPIPPSLASIGIPNIPECHAMMYAEWVKRGRPPLEHITDLSLGWEPVYGEPVWTKSIRYRFKHTSQDDRNKALRHLLDEMPIANFRDNQPRSAEQKSALQSQVGGDHYAKLKIQPVEYIHANSLSFIEGCVVKYVTRHKAKNGKQDLEKARHFLDMLIELEYPDAD